MTYGILPTDPSASKAFRRIAAEQLDRATQALESAGNAEGEARALRIHESRKAVKRTRGLLRLFRDAFPDQKPQDRALRDAGRQLAELRDQGAMLETFERISAAHADRLDRRRLVPLRRALTEQRDSARDTAQLEDRVALVRGALLDVRHGVDGWRLKSGGWSALEPGLTRSYGAARDMMDRALKTRDPEDLHDWRKRVKDHWYHTRLLSPVWREGMHSHRKALETLADLLGQHHDLDVFMTWLEDAELAEAPKQSLTDAIAAERVRLEAEVAALGPRALAESSKALAKRWKVLWRARDQTGAAEVAAAV